jgi:hypothetical protein
MMHITLTTDHVRDSPRGEVDETVLPRRAPLVTIGTVVHQDESQLLWNLLHKPAQGMLPLATQGGQPPTVPWCAARLEIGITLHPLPTEWLGDFERCIAWAWMDCH